MRKQTKKILGGTLAMSFLVAGLTVGKPAYAATADIGAIEALTDSEYTLEEMLLYAIEDEYLAQAEYQAIIDQFEASRPFSNVIRAEANHINILTTVLENHEVAIPNEDWASKVSVPETIEEAYTEGVKAEENNIAMYEGFLKEALPDDVKAVFERLLAASQKHLAAFQNAEDGFVNCLNGTGNGVGKGQGGQGRGQGQGQGRGQGGQGQGLGQAQGTCILENTEA